MEHKEIGTNENSNINPLNLFDPENHGNLRYHKKIVYIYIYIYIYIYLIQNSLKSQVRQVV